MNILNKIVRDATLENMADTNGVIDVDAFASLYNHISAQIIITGFVYVSENGRAMQPRQAGIVTEEQFQAWKKLVAQVKKNKKASLIMQLAHTGRQTTRQCAVGAGTKKCSYFKTRIKELTLKEIEHIINDFVSAATKASEAGFDGVQIHAAHGYLIHQFLSPDTNTRKDKYNDYPLFLEEILKKIKEKCPKSFKIGIKISHADDKKLTLGQTIQTIKRIEKYIDFIEVSYGTMEYPLNIIRGECHVDTALKVNPLFNKYPRWLLCILKKVYFPWYVRRFIPYQPLYNLKAAEKIKKNTIKEVWLTGGIRSLKDIQTVLQKGIDKVCLCRPFICEPNLVDRIKMNKWQQSLCSNCNLCTIMCDSNTKNALKCYQWSQKHEI